MAVLNPATMSLETLHTLRLKMASESQESGNFFRQNDSEQLENYEEEHFKDAVTAYEMLRYYLKLLKTPGQISRERRAEYLPDIQNVIQALTGDENAAKYFGEFTLPKYYHQLLTATKNYLTVKEIAVKGQILRFSFSLYTEWLMDEKEIQDAPHNAKLELISETADALTPAFEDFNNLWKAVDFDMRRGEEYLTRLNKSAEKLIHAVNHFLQRLPKLTDNLAQAEQFLFWIRGKRARLDRDQKRIEENAKASTKLKAADRKASMKKMKRFREGIDRLRDRLGITQTMFAHQRKTEKDGDEAMAQVIGERLAAERKAVDAEYFELLERLDLHQSLKLMERKDLLEACQRGCVTPFSKVEDFCGRGSVDWRKCFMDKRVPPLLEKAEAGFTFFAHPGHFLEYFKEEKKRQFKLNRAPVECASPICYNTSLDVKMRTCVMCVEARENEEDFISRYCSEACQMHDWRQGGHRRYHDNEEKNKRRCFHGPCSKPNGPDVKLRVCVECRDAAGEDKLGKDSVLKAYYCSKECQKEDWKAGHEEYHQQLADIIEKKMRWTKIDENDNFKTIAENDTIIS